MKNIRLAVVTALALGMGALSSRAEGAWEWAVTPYVFLPALDIDSTVAGQTTPVDLSFSDVWDMSDVLAFSLRGEAWKDQWGGVGDFYWVDIQAKGGPEDAVKVDVEEWYVDALGAYRWLFPGAFSRPASVDVTFGLRFHYLDQRIGAAALPRDLGGSEEWVDLMIGARYLQPLAEQWLFLLRGDIGGFDLTDGTKLNYSATGGFGWEFTRGWLLDLGYRVYGIDYESGSGLDNFGMDGVEHGLWLGVTYAAQAR
jgi:hypothetical protein